MKYFGTDGIRGKALEKLNSELAYKLGQGIYETFKPHIIVIGMDTRESSPMLAYALANGLMARGVDILFAGVVSTPMIANYSKVHQMIGVMITASHNPFTDNGIKVFNKGYKTIETDELKIETFIDYGTLKVEKYGTFTFSDDIEQEYLKIYKPIHLKPSNLKVIYDSANGANHIIAKKLFDIYAPNSIQLGNTPNGKNINLDCGSTHLDHIQSLHHHQSYDIAFSFDGDGDRIIILDGQGHVYDGDLIIYMIAKYLKSKKMLNHDTVVLTKMSNPGLLEALRKHEISYELTDVGDKYVFEALENGGYTIGGESSGHIILTHLLHSGDGLLVALYMLHILDELKTTLKELTEDVTFYPLKLTNIKGIDKSVLKREVIINKVQQIKNDLGDSGLLLVRPSGTESLIRITVSAKDEQVVDNITHELVQMIEKEGKHL